MKVLFFCNTYYQLIIAIQMSLTIKEDSNVSLILTNASKNSAQVYSNLIMSGIFEHTYYLEINKKKSFFEYLKEGILGLVPRGMENDLFYDELIGFNYDLSTCAVYAALEKENPNIFCNVIEEGLLSYNMYDSTCRVSKIIDFLRKYLNKGNARKKRKFFYCFNRQAYRGELIPFEIPVIRQNNIRFRRILNSIFLNGKEPELYQEKYIYLSSVYDFEGGEPVGELELIIKIAEVVGYENLIVKVHPRDNEERFKKVGLKVAENSAVPWEVLQISCDFSEKVLISSFSGSLINLNSIVDRTGKNIYIYHLCHSEKNVIAQRFEALIDEYVNNPKEYGLKRINAVFSIEEILE